MRLFGEFDTRKPVSAALEDLRLTKNLDLDAAALVEEKLTKENFIASGFQKPIQLNLDLTQPEKSGVDINNPLGDKVAIGTNADSLPEQDEFIKTSKSSTTLPPMAAKQYDHREVNDQKKAELPTREIPKRTLTDQEKMMLCISRLPRVERDLITMVEIKKKSIQEIAIEKHLDKSEIELHLGSARKRLKELFFEAE
jgi:chlorophyllide a reductase subunit X